VGTKEEWARFGLTEPEAAALTKAIENYAAERFRSEDTIADARQEAWLRVLTVLSSGSSLVPTGSADKLRYLKTIMCNAAFRFVEREELDGPLDNDGRTQHHRIESTHP